MCSPEILSFVDRALPAHLVTGRRVLEVGALDVNGSVRSIIEARGPARYLGTDIASGPGVDEVVPAETLVEHFGPASFDVVITTEMFEHVRDWRPVAANLQQVLAPGGRLVLTTRSWDFMYHGFPHDYWRWELDDLRVVFAGLDIAILESDPHQPGCFLAADQSTSPEPREVPDVTDYRVRNILDGRRVARITPAMERAFRFRRKTVRIAKRSRVKAGKARLAARRTLSGGSVATG